MIRSDAERLRTANAILSEVLASPSVPNGLRRLAASFVQESQDVAKLRRSLDDGLALAEQAHHQRLIREGQS